MERTDISWLRPCNASSLLNGCAHYADLQKELREPGSWGTKMQKGIEHLKRTYDGVKFQMVAPPFVTLREQTANRLTKAGLNPQDDMCVLSYTKVTSGGQVGAVDSIKHTKRTLHVKTLLCWSRSIVCRCCMTIVLPNSHAKDNDPFCSLQPFDIQG